MLVLDPASEFARSLRHPSTDSEWLDYQDRVARNEIHMPKNGQ